jgi:hypothetical protein
MSTLMLTSESIVFRSTNDSWNLATARSIKVEQQCDDLCGHGFLHYWNQCPRGLRRAGRGARGERQWRPRGRFGARQ